MISQEPWWLASPRPAARRIDAPRFAEALQGNTLLVLARSDSLLCCVSAIDGRIELTMHRLPGPMGLAWADGRLAIGCATDVRVYADIADGDDAAFLPLAMHATGAISVHDLAWADGRLWIANTLFSTICTLEPGGLHPRWRPAFIAGDDSPVDACHLNGMVVDGGGVAWATALAASGGAQGWRACGPDRGVLLDGDGRVHRDDLSLPHSPTPDDGRLLLLEAGRGRLLAFAPTTAQARPPEVLAEFPGVVRGLAASPRALFVARSPVRASSGETGAILGRRFPRPLPCALHACARDGSAIAELPLPFLGEIASLHLLPRRTVNLLRPDPAQHAATYVVAG